MIGALYGRGSPPAPFGAKDGTTVSTTDQAERWPAIRCGDATYDGRFVGACPSLARDGCRPPLYVGPPRPSSGPEVGKKSGSMMEDLVAR